MKKLIAFMLLLWVALMPPLFTQGQCSAEYQAFTASMQKNMPRLGTPDAARRFLESQHLPYRLLSAEQCRRGGLRAIEHCSSGSTVYAEASVRNPICRIYRDDTMRVALHYDLRNRLHRIEFYMAPVKFLPLPWGGQIDWAG
jgi:hypothetical protein